MKRLFSISLLAAAFWMTAAQAGQYDSCVTQLAAGNNRFHVKLSSDALTRLAQAIENDKSKNTTALFVDYTRNSRVRRAFLVDFKACDVISQDHVIHGGSIYHPVTEVFGDDGKGDLVHCTHNGSLKDMTRPGLFITAGCHTTDEANWTNITGSCQGVNLKSLDSLIHNSDISGVVLHEHHAILDDNSVKLAGQGCPAFPPGRLEAMLRYGVMNGMLVLVYAPQCDTEVRLVKQPTMAKTQSHIQSN